MNKNKFFKSFVFAFKGIREAFRTQGNLRFHVFTSIAVIISGFALHVSSTEWCILLLCIGVVISAELINSAIETTIDFVSPDFNKKAGRAKDVSAGAVLIVSIISAVVGMIIFIPRIIHLVSQ